MKRVFHILILWVVVFRYLHFFGSYTPLFEAVDGFVIAFLLARLYANSLTYLTLYLMSSVLLGECANLLNLSDNNLAIGAMTAFFLFLTIFKYPYAKWT